jgi:hypothetical protein
MRKILVICCLFLLVTNCEEDVTLNPEGFKELPVNINGNWTIDKATQNGTDITDKLDFETFTINLNYDGDQPTTFSIPVFNVPFGIDFSTGSWVFDDITYPTKLIFTSSNGNTTTVDLDTIPLVSGVDNFNLTFNTGCDSNIYVYNFKNN